MLIRDVLVKTRVFRKLFSTCLVAIQPPLTYILGQFRFLKCKVLRINHRDDVWRIRREV